MAYTIHRGECSDPQHDDPRRYRAVNDLGGVYLTADDHAEKVFEMLQRSTRNAILLS